MKVLLLNGSPNARGNTYTALSEMEKVLSAEGFETEMIQIGNLAVRGCLGCNTCQTTGKCVIDDIVNEIAVKFEACDGIVFGTPVYYGSVNGTLMALLQRLFFSTKFDKRMKVGASVVVARRGGLSSTYDELNKFFGISGMPIVAGQYWNSLHGLTPGEVKQDPEGMQGMRTLARNMSFLMKSIALGKETIGMPEKEAQLFTNFIR